MQVHWLRVILDEGHMLGASLAITNKLQMACALRADRYTICLLLHAFFCMCARALGVTVTHSTSIQMTCAFQVCRWSHAPFKSCKLHMA